MTRILSIDYGNKRVGLAVSDPLKMIATSLPTMTIASMDDAVKNLFDILQNYDIEAIIIGYPLGISGKKTDQTEIVDKFIKKMKELTKIVIIPWDERYTSVEAKQILREKGVKSRHDKGLIDQMSARIILQEYLNSISGGL